MRVALLLAGIVVVVLVVGSLAVNEGEVVTLTTLDGKGARYETPLWIVELDGSLYLRSGSPRARWLERLQARPQVILHRDDTERPFLARPVNDPELRDAVNRAMAAKYGATDRFWGLFFDCARAVPIELEPRQAEGGG